MLMCLSSNHFNSITSWLSSNGSGFSLCRQEKLSCHPSPALPAACHSSRRSLFRICLISRGEAKIRLTLGCYEQGCIARPRSSGVWPSARSPTALQRQDLRSDRCRCMPLSMQEPSHVTARLRRLTVLLLYVYLPAQSYLTNDRCVDSVYKAILARACAEPQRYGSASAVGPAVLQDAQQQGPCSACLLFLTLCVVCCSEAVIAKCIALIKQYVTR